MRVETRSFPQEAMANRAVGAGSAQRPASNGIPPLIAGGRNQPEQITDDVVKGAAEAANKVASMFGTTVEFAVHEETGFEILQIIDTRTNTVLREMPPHEILDMIARMWDAIGVFVDKTA
mgnify:CR=1 FL=1